MEVECVSRHENECQKIPLLLFFFWQQVSLFFPISFSLFDSQPLLSLPQFAIIDSQERKREDVMLAAVIQRCTDDPVKRVHATDSMRVNDPQRRKHEEKQTFPLVHQTLVKRESKRLLYRVVEKVTVSSLCMCTHS